MACEYLIRTQNNGDTPILTEEEFKTVLRTLGLTLNDDSNSETIKQIINALGSENNVKFSVQTNKEVEDIIIDISNRTKDEIKLGVVNDSILSSADYSFDKRNIISACTLIENTQEEHQIAMSLDDEAFAKAYCEQEMQRDPSQSIEDVMARVEKIKRNWQNLSRDGMLLHNFMPIALWAAWKGETAGGTTSYLQEKLQQFKYKDLNGVEHKLSDRFDLTQLPKIMESIGRISYYLHETTKAIRPVDAKHLTSLHFKSKIKPDLKDRAGASEVGIHVDNIYVGNDNRIYLFNYKFCQDDYTRWAINKREKYIKEMALIREILSDNGIDVTSGQFFNIPIQIEYNDEGKIVGWNFKGTALQDMGIPYSARNSRAPLVSQEIVDSLLNFIDGQNRQATAIKRTSFVTSIQNSDKLLKLINPKFNAKMEGLNISAKAWIRSHYGTNIVNAENGIGYDVILKNGEKHHIENNQNYKDNTELEQFVQAHLEELAREIPIVTSTIIDSILTSYETGTPKFSGFGMSGTSAYLSRQLTKYFMYTENSTGKKEYEWNFLLNDDLNQLGIILFQNRNTNQVDVISVCPFDLYEKIPTKYSQNGLLGYHEMDMMMPKIDMQSSYGDMEAIRVMEILNQVVKQYGDMKFGNLSIFSPYFSGTARSFSINRIAKQYSQIIKYINQKFDTTFEQYFKQSNFVDPFEIIRQCINSIYKNKPIASSLLSATDVAQKYASIKDLVQMMENEYFHTKDPDRIEEYKTSTNEQRRAAYEIYHNAQLWLFRYSGDYQVQVKHIDSLFRNALPTYANPDENVRMVSDMFNAALNNTASQFRDLYTPFNKKLRQFEEAKGINFVNREIIGSTENIFSKMFQIDPNTGKKTWRFVNPYNDEAVALAGLDSDEVSFLKSYLFFMAGLRARAHEQVFNFTDENDSRLKEYIESHSDYLIVPLTKATNIKHTIQNKINATGKLIQRCNTTDKLKETLKEWDPIHESTHTTGSIPNSSIYSLGENPLSSHRTLLFSENETQRQVLMSEKPESYFEQDLGNIACEYAAQQIWYENMQNVELQAKAVMWCMHHIGEEGGRKAKEIIDESLSHVEEFVKVNMYGQSIMSDSGKAFSKAMELPQRLMRAVFIAGNLRSMFRDTFEGIMQNTVRTLTHYHNNLSTANVYAGYGQVMQHIFTSDRAMNKMSELCLRYRLSNCDTARIAERAKRGQGGILNPMSMSFSTLRGPDFLNRMVLFVARCKEDGVWDAFDMVDGELIYDPKKDERFKAYFDGIKGSKEYLEAKSKYFSACLQYNQEHRNEKQLVIGQDLLSEPYSDKEIKNLKEFSDSIYGAYDQSQKARYERLALGHALGVFTTWMNGTIAAWLRQPGKYSSYYTSIDPDGKTVIKTSDAGNELYFKEDGGLCEKIGDNYYDCDTGEKVENNGDCPVVGEVPVMVQGILYTFKDIWHVLREDGLNPESFKTKIWAAYTNRENLKKLFGDATAYLLYLLLFGLIFTPKYKEHLKSKECNNLIVDGATELFYHSAYSAFDGFAGPYSIVNFLLNDIEPTVATANLGFLRNATRYAMGDTTFKAFIYGNLPIFRSFKDTAKMYDSDAFKTIPKDE